jgi:hypothetical protein
MLGNVANPAINHPQVITVFLGAISTIPNGSFMALGISL